MIWQAVSNLQMCSGHVLASVLQGEVAKKAEAGTGPDDSELSDDEAERSEDSDDEQQTDKKVSRTNLVGQSRIS